MPNLKVPSILIDLGHVGEHGLPINPAAWFQKELEVCREWGFSLKYLDERVSLQFNQDLLIPYWIQKETPAIAWDGLRVNSFLRIDSTNTEAYEMARNGAPQGTLVVAEEQTEGKGRKGRSWVSVAAKGLSFSLVLRPVQPLKFWPLLTHVASVALVEVLKELHPLKVIPHALDIDLKWPNDVLISGRKCAGILLETMTVGSTPAAVVGLGINIRKGSVPESLKDTAVCLDEMADLIVPRRQVLVRFLHRFQECYSIFEQGKHRELLERWKRHSSMWKGAQVWITEGEERRSAVTCGLSEIGGLMVRTPAGKVETVLAGDVSVRQVARAPIGIDIDSAVE
jgi:BirA family transcriptional regulator, biotin operon repressor / biotin---[acetyl-CoA-carboxylase] ligase